MDELFKIEPKVLSVGELTRRVRDLLEGTIGEIWVEGEISNHRKQASGHQYFTLKDDRAQLACVLFARSGVRQKLEDGMAVQVFGSVTVYEARGQYQMIVQLAQPRGQGVLQAKFEALKRKLEAEGLFDPSKRLPLPSFPRTIGLVTSPTGAALQDMINVFARRAPWLKLLLIPVKVQGDGAAAEIAGAIRQFNRDFFGKVDLLLIGRGGGSIEDLWPFNEESVARAIAESRIPVVSAVGHEIDFTIADFAADLRAPTPSAAAEMVVPDGAEMEHRLDVLSRRLRQHLQSTIAHDREKLIGRLAPMLERETARVIASHQQTLDLLGTELVQLTKTSLTLRQQQLSTRAASLDRHRPDHLFAFKKQSFLRQRDGFFATFQKAFAARKRQFDQTAGLLRVLGPEATLKRGFTITRRADGTILTSARELKKGAKIRTRLSDGEILSSVTFTTP